MVVSRRRFHGYCPAIARKISDVVVITSSDDYTTTLNSLAICARAPNDVVLSGGVIEASFSNLDDDDLILTSDDLGEEKYSDEDFFLSRHSSLIHRQRREDPDAKSVLASLKFHRVSNDSEEKEEEIFRYSDSRSDSSSVQMLLIAERVEFIPDDHPDSLSVKELVIAERVEDIPDDHPDKPTEAAFLAFRFNYLIVTVAIMLADGLQGTHLYVLYEGYGYSVASLYCLGFVTGAVTSPITGALVDRLGRKKAALIYCALEMGINMLEQYPVLAGLILCRMVGGITTNLLSSVFETWLDTEYRRRGFDKERYEIIMRDSVVASNLAAIASGYLAHHLAERFGPVGPFEGAVACTAVAFAVVAFVWTENYGTSDLENIKSIRGYMLDAVQTFKADSKVLRVGIIQGLTTGSIQIFIFLWSPALRELAKNAPKNVLGLDSEGEPAYGLVFGAFMACGVLGGLVSPFVRKGVTALISPLTKATPETIEVEGEVIRPMAVEFLAAASYLVCAGLLLVPCALPSNGVFAFSIALLAFMVYEFMVGIYMPCEGVIRSIYIPSDARCSLMTFPRIIVNIAVSIGVISTEFVSLSSAFCAVSSLMIISAMLQLSLISSREWGSLFGRVDLWKKQAARSMSFSALPCDPKSRDLRRAVSTPTYFFSYDEDGEGKKSK